jgi:hypothetical protein
MSNGVAMAEGCEWHGARWVRDGHAAFVRRR